MLKHIQLNDIVTIAKKADDAILEIYNRDFQITSKENQSPFTEANTKSNEIICITLVKAYPNIPMLSNLLNSWFIVK